MPWNYYKLSIDVIQLRKEDNSMNNKDSHDDMNTNEMINSAYQNLESKDACTAIIVKLILDFTIDLVKIFR